MSQVTAMTLERLQELLNAFGAQSDSWPDSERAAALKLVMAQPEARRRFEEAVAFDGLLRTAPDAPVSERLLARVLEIPESMAPRTSRATRPGWWPFESMSRPLTTLAVAAAFGLLLGSLIDPDSSSVAPSGVELAAEGSPDEWSGMSELALATHLDSEDLP
jgi:hypothetical protein